MKRAKAAVGLLALAATCALSGCSGDDGDSKDGADAGAAIVPDTPPPADPDRLDGTFLGQVEGTSTHVAVVAAPAAAEAEDRDVMVFVCDGGAVSEWFSATSSGNTFEAESLDGDAALEGSVTQDGVTGSLTLAGGDEMRYATTRALGAAGLYDLSVTAEGGLDGATSAGVGVTGKAPVEPPGEGSLTLADGRTLPFAVSAYEGEENPAVVGQARLIVLPDGAVVGTGRITDGAGFVIGAS